MGPWCGVYARAAMSATTMRSMRPGWCWDRVSTVLPPMLCPRNEALAMPWASMNRTTSSAISV